ncbi:hypothetical protein PENCOP_c011G02719 [Penicillium coprophilum]|uniref:Uncharacterized protein n=1 Tax=Penicillium coprophilum TaxID=36646 RepID=A0A1V6UE17_9EURO|nr:hypothetical protein PENCOP_c011G02719 [Penicillium coprophilum]
MNKENERGNPPKPQSSNTTPAPTPAPSSTSNTQPPPNPSLATRIQTSATALAKTAFNPGSDISHTLASSTSSKPAGPSLPNTQISRDLSTHTQQGAPSSGSASTPTYAAQAFREHDPSTGGFALPTLTEDEFQRNVYEYDGIDATTATTTTTTNEPQSQSNHDDLQTPSSTWKGKARAHDPTQHQLETVWQRQWDTPKQKYIPSTDDGAAVVSLLSDTNFDPNFEDPTTLPDTEIDIAAAPAPLSAAEREALDSFLKGTGVEEGRSQGRFTGASLVPDIDVFLSQGVGSGVGFGEGNGLTMGGSTSTSLRDAVLMDLPGAGDWVGVQERYHDEVWGYLEPVLEDAKTEIEKGGGEGTGDGEDGPAVRRLKMILMHMKG